MIKKLTFLLFLFTFAFFAEAHAQSVVAPEKKAAIKELIAIINEDNSVDKLMEMMNAQSDDLSKKTVKRWLDEDKTLSPADKKTVEDLLLNSEPSFFRRYQDKLVQRLNLSEMLEEIMTAVYEKHYTLEEIREIIVFYKSPVGQKTLKLTPQIFAETMGVLMDKMMVKMTEVTKELENEMRREFEEKVKAQKQNRKKPVSE